MTALFVGAMAACSDDDDNSGGKAGNGVLAMESGENYQLNYCYMYDSNDGELLFTDFNFFSGIVPTKCQQLHIDFEQPINTINQVTLGSDEYYISFYRDSNLELETNDGYYVWATSRAFTNVKQPGNLTITRDGNNITVKIENFWIYGGKGFSGWSHTSLPQGFEWKNGSFQYSGPVIDLSAYVDAE